MTVSSTLNRKTYAGNGVTTSFATSPVVFFDDDDLTVYVTTDATGVSETLVLDTDYTVSGGAGSTGTVSLAGGSDPYGAPATGKTVVIVRTLDVVQEYDPENNDINDAEALERALDKLTMMVQQNAAQIGRTVRQPDGDTDTISTLPSAVDRASSVLGFDTDGDITLYNSSSSVTTSDNVTYTPAGTGATARTLQARLRDRVSSSDYSSLANFRAARDALTATLGAYTIEASGRFVGGSWTEDGSDPNFVSNRTINDAADGSAHGFQDFTVFSKGTGSSQYNSFYSNAGLSGAKNFTHIRGGQMYLKNQATGTVDEITSYLSQPRLYAGSTTTEINHFYVAASLASSGTPSVVTEYGLRIAGSLLPAGTTWAIHSSWAAESKLGGGLQLANNKYFQVWDSSGTSRNVLGIDGSNDLYIGNSGISGNYYIMKGPVIPNNSFLQAKDSGSVNRAILGIDASNVLQIGVSGISGGITMSHGPLIPNNSYLKGNDVGGTARNLIGIDGSDDMYLAASALAGRIYVLRPLFTTASTTSNAGFRVPHGSAPTSPVDGDMWTTTAGLFVRINGSTVGPLS